MNLPQTEYRRIRWTTRMFAAGLALSVVFALTPCCDIYAAFIPGAAHAAALDHAAVSDDHAGGGDQPCAAWLDRNDALPVGTGALPTAASELAIPVSFVFHLLPSRFTTMRQPSVASVSFPDALYLRYLRLIL